MKTLSKNQITFLIFLEIIKLNFLKLKNNNFYIVIITMIILFIYSILLGNYLMHNFQINSFIK